MISKAFSAPGAFRLGGKAALAVGLGLACASAHDRAEPVRHVLLISIDGMHALDLARFVAGHPGSALARLSSAGATYTEASTSKPSDSYPGLMAMVTGGSPISTGVYYDDSYDRNMCAPGSDCSVHGTEVVYDESVDINPDSLDAGGGIDPKALPLDPMTKKPVYPHQFLRVNTVFEVVKAAGGRTAWSDKHPTYEIVNGPSGRGLDDLFAPEINNAGNPTGSVSLCEGYDDIKVNAIRPSSSRPSTANRPSIPCAGKWWTARSSPTSSMPSSPASWPRPPKTT